MKIEDVKAGDLITRKCSNVKFVNKIVSVRMDEVLAITLDIALGKTYIITDFLYLYEKYEPKLPNYLK